MIENHASKAVEYSVKKESGVVGIDDNNGEINCISFDRIKGGKPFDINYDWFCKLLKQIEQS